MRRNMLLVEVIEVRAQDLQGGRVRMFPVCTAKELTRSCNLAICWCCCRRHRSCVPYTSINPNLADSLAVTEVTVGERLERLQAPIKGAGVNDINRRLDTGEVVRKLLGLLDAFRRQRRICRNTGRRFD